MMALKAESQELNEMEENDRYGKHDFTNGEKYFSCSQIEILPHKTLLKRLELDVITPVESVEKVSTEIQNLQST